MRAVAANGRAMSLPTRALPLPLPLVLLLLGVSSSVRAQHSLCPLAQLDQWNDIDRICCESSTGAADCTNGFPTVCTRECAALLEPFWTSCGTLVELLGDAFACDEVALDRFSKNECHRTNVLFEHAAVGSCPVEMLEAWTDDVNAACCEQDPQNGVYQCTAGTPWTCDAECAIEFGPYWENCMIASGTDGSPDLQAFAALYQTCRTLPPTENGVLISSVNDLMADPFCSINTTQIISTDRANAPCSVDSSSFCARTLQGGVFTCAADYCPSCHQAHVCDNSCGFPCVSQAGGPTGGSAVTVSTNICNSDSSSMCSRTIAAGLFSCSTDYCLTCPQSHTCDNSCSLPCGDTGPDTGGRHRRQLGGNTIDLLTNPTEVSRVPKRRRTQNGPRGGLFANSVFESTQCPLEGIVARAEQVSEQCCSSFTGADCANGMPNECTFECSRFYIPFMQDCNLTMHKIFPEQTLSEFVAFGSECARMDTMSVVRAISGAVCTTCGDSVTQAPLEQCDDGANNSYAPNSCRPNCQLPSCGDGVTDTLTEGCDDGALNAPDGTCGLDCRPTCSPSTQRFDYTGAAQTYVAECSSVRIECFGARGGNARGNQGGQGGHAIGVYNTQPGTNLFVFVGGAGQDSGPTTTTGGWNGGGRGNGGSNGGGGGASDVRLLSNTDPIDRASLASRIIVAAGGGGATQNSQCKGGDGGANEGETPPNGGSDRTAGAGGTQVVGGCAEATRPVTTGSICGSSGQGGHGWGGSDTGTSISGGGWTGGGGAGWFGGGGSLWHAGGGGGSNYVGGLADAQSHRGGNPAAGYCILTSQAE